jgi:membrane protein implicated in regulation of membrane protease activity
MWWIWLIAAVLLGVVEMLTVDLVAGLVALLLLAVVRPWAKTLLLRSTPDTPMNVRGLVGQIAITLVEVTDRSGLVKLAGEEWSARTAPGVMPRPVGEDVRVVEITGAHAIVAPLDAPTAGFGTAPQPTWSANSPATGPGVSNPTIPAAHRSSAADPPHPTTDMGS